MLARPGRYQGVADNLEVKEVLVNGRRYVVCRNPEEAKKDAASRAAAILAKFETTLAHGPKGVNGSKGCARFVTVQRGSVTINRAAIEADPRLDGKFVLHTNTTLAPDEVARA